MRHLFDPEGERALRALTRHEPLLAFDFDGTLAPIVDRPAEARVPASLAQRLARLAALRPLAIVTGRDVADVQSRLGFEPGHIVGNHGAEHGASRPGPGAAALDDLRRALARREAELRATGVQLEDKRHSLALHYRLAPERDLAAARIGEWLHGLDPALRIFGGRYVVNVVDAAAPDKGQALIELVRLSRAGAAAFVGDDVNDEAVFERAPAHWLTVRIGRDDPRSRARFFLDSQAEVQPLIERLLRAFEAPAPRAA